MEKLIAQPTLTAFELDRGEKISFQLSDGSAREIELVGTAAQVMFTTLKQPRTEERGARTFYEFTCELKIDGHLHRLRREVPTQDSFYDPWEIAGLRIWFDAVEDIFDFLIETHGPCRPTKHARFAIQDAMLRVCPDHVHPWCPLPAERLDIMLCYCGEDCWMGPYFGASAHGGLDINHPACTPIVAPIAFDDHYYFNSVEKGDNNNRHRAHRHWDDGSEWILQCHHMTRLTVGEHTQIAAGQKYADGAGVLNGYHPHSHFEFKIRQRDQLFLLDPWILFWQMYQDLKRE